MILGFIGALLIGLSLGVFGSGGSILAVPILAYLVGQPEKVAIAGSLAVVAGISLAAAVPYARKRRVDWRSVVLFGLPGMAGTYLGAGLALYVPGAVQMALFAVVMLVAAVMMLRSERQEYEPGEPRARYKVVADGLAVGVLTGLVGVGGGFLIVPALVLLGGLPMRLAVGTSLIIITLKSISGFVKYVDVLATLGLSLDWSVIGLFIVVGTLASWVGGRISASLPQTALRQGFAVFLVIMAVGILFRSTVTGLM